VSDSAATRGMTSARVGRIRIVVLALIAVVVCAGVALFRLPSIGSTAPAQSTLTSTPLLPAVSVENGVRMLRHDRNAFARAPQLELVSEPVSVAGGVDVDPVYDLTGAHQFRLLSDGRIMAIAGAGARVLQFAPNGKPERVIGGQGQGPGEFMSPDGFIPLRGDTLLIPDRSNNRLNTIVANKGIVQHRPMPQFPELAFPSVIGIFDDGQLVLENAERPHDTVSDTIFRSMRGVFALDSDGDAKLIVQLPGPERRMMRMTNRGRPFMVPIAVRFSRGALTVVADSTLITATGLGYAFDHRDVSGNVLTRVTVDVARRPVTKAMRDTLLEMALMRFRQSSAEGMVNPAESERIEREAPYADSLPPYEYLFQSPDRTLWIVDAIAPGDNQWSATAFRTDGSIAGRLVVPERGTPVAFGNDRVVVHSTDDDGVVSLIVRRIQIKAR
jgi:hypothetical protein